MRATVTVVAVCSLVAAAVHAGASRKREMPDRFRPDSRIVYKETVDATGGPVELRLHLFRPAVHRAADRRPAIVFFFGGGWVGGTPGQFYPQCAYLASRGMVAMAAEYRVRSREGITPFECVADGMSAIRYVRAHAAELGIDARRVAAGGGSAGGHVAACTGTVSEALGEKGEGRSVSCRPDALVLFNPVVDCSPVGFGFPRLRDRWRELSPVHNVTKETPPAILFHGTGDTTVSFATAEAFAAAMKAAGRRCELVAFEGAKHGFFNYGRDGNQPFVKTVDASDRFLTSLGWLNGEPSAAAFVERAATARTEDEKKR